MYNNDDINEDNNISGSGMNSENAGQETINNESAASQENAAGQETQYRYSKNDIPFNNNTENNQSYQNDYTNNNSYQNGYNYNNTAYNNGYNYNGSAQYNDMNYNYNNQSQQDNPYYSNINQNMNQNMNSNMNPNMNPNMNQNMPGSKKKEHSKKNGSDFIKNKVVRLVASALVFGVIAGGVMYGLYFAGVSAFPNKRNSTYEIQTVAPNLSTNYQVEGEAASSTGMNVEAVAQAALPAMVELNGTTKVSGSSYGFWGQQTQEAQTSGTGIIVGKNDTELLILTNAHVIDGVNNLSCSFVDSEAVECSVKGSKTDKDIAVVAVDLDKIKDSTLNSIAIAELGESDDVVLGQQVVAIGNALGEGQSVTSGIVSALNRSITVNNVTFSGLFLTDAAINSGNSGGALLDAAGKVVGINFAKTSESGVEGMAYSIPVSTVRDLIDSLMTREKRNMVSDDKASYLGISAVDITSSIAQTYSYPQGVLINQVVSGSAAEKAGLGAYDIVVSFDDQTITSMSGLQSIMKYYAAGETVKVEYYHMEGNEYVLKSVDVTLGKKN